MKDQALLKECVQYFRDNGGFVRVFEKMKSKFHSLGHIGGTIALQNLSPQERDALSGFLKKDYSRQKSASIKLESFQKSLDGTRFCGLALEDILRAYFDEELISNKQARNNYEKDRNSFFTELKDEYSNTPGGEWLGHIWAYRGSAYKTLVQRYDADKAALRQDIDAVCRAINNLPCSRNERVRLPVFASDITKNPHAFDNHTACGQLFVHALTYVFSMCRPESAEERAELYYGAGILSDEVSSFVLCSGLKAYEKNGLHPGWEGFCLSNEPVQATLMNLSRLHRIISPWDRVYAVENPGVFTAILDRTSQENVPLICTYGHVRIASLVLMDMLVKEGTDIYYSGDFDPEGLLIADKLKSRYGEKLKLWRYSPDDYVNALSDRPISSMRIKKLESIKDKSLVSLSQCIKENLLAGYQELLIDKLIEDISTFTF